MSDQRQANLDAIADLAEQVADDPPTVLWVGDHVRVERHDDEPGLVLVSIVGRNDDEALTIFDLDVLEAVELIQGLAAVLR